MKDLGDQGESPFKKTDQKNRISPSASTAQTQKGGRGPGDLKISLNLNQVLVILLFAIVLVLSGYFSGYYKGRDISGSETSLSNAEPGPFLLKDPTDQREIGKNRSTRSEGDRWNSTQEISRPERGTKKETQSEPFPTSDGDEIVTPEAVSGYGVLVASYNSNKESIVNQTCRILVERGFKGAGITKYFYEKDRKFAIIIGSFGRRDHPDLIRLRDRIRNIDDFPGGDPAPFTTARVKKHPQREVRNRVDP